MLPDPSTTLSPSKMLNFRCECTGSSSEADPLLEHRVGARPTRATIRVEEEVGEDGTVVVHNYGHGGAGVTLSWGCAEEARALLSVK